MLGGGDGGKRRASRVRLRSQTCQKHKLPDSRQGSPEEGTPSASMPRVSIKLLKIKDKVKNLGSKQRERTHLQGEKQ